MATAGPAQFTAVAEFDAGEVPWTNPGNAITDNNGYATVSIGGDFVVSNFLDYTIAGLTGPADGDTVTNVLFEVACKNTVGGIEASVYQLQMIVAGSVVGSPVSGDQMTSTESYVGNSAATSVSIDFGTTLTGAQVKASGFGVRVQLRNNALSEETLSVDAARVTVTYTAAGGSVAPLAVHHRKQQGIA